MAKNADPIYFAVLNFVRYAVFLPFGGVRVLHRDRMPMAGPVIPSAANWLMPALCGRFSRRKLFTPMRNSLNIRAVSARVNPAPKLCP